MQYLKVITPLVICLLLIPVLAQQPVHGIPAIETAIDEDRLDDAARMLEQDISKWLDKNNIDTLISYIPLKATIAEKKNGNKAAIKATYQLIDLMAAKKMNTLQSVAAYQAAAYYFDQALEAQEAYNAMLKALSFANLLESKKNYHVSKCQYNLGVFAYKMGKIKQTEEHHRIAMEIRKSDPSTSAEDLYFSYNALGTGFWHSYIYDSARRYFMLALEYVKKSPQDNINKYFRPALIRGNLVGIYREQGDMSKALLTAQEAIDDYQQFINGKGGDSKKKYATESWCAAIENLAGIYQDIGDYRKAGDLLLYAYQQKQQKFPGSYAVAISEILLGQHYNKLREFSRSRELLLSALTRLQDDNGEYTFWQADAYYALARNYEQTNQAKEAGEAYEQSEKLYEQAYAGSYDNIYMEFLNSKARFFALHELHNKAIATAKKTGDYLSSIGENASTQGFLHLLNLSEINYLTRHYTGSIEYSNQALEHLRQQFRSGNNQLDSIQSEIHKPATILIKAKATYALQQEKDPVLLSGIYHQLDTALQILERRKVFIADPENIKHLMIEYQDLMDFFGRISLELYNRTSNNQYLEKFINIREAALYSRIRSRLNKEKAIRFSNVPEDVISKENKLKEQIEHALSDTGADSGRLSGYLKTLKDWEDHLEDEKNRFPEYYRLRYATLFYKLEELQALVPENTTLVRYYIIDTTLAALVADRHSGKIVLLNGSGLTEKVNAVVQNSLNEQDQLVLLHQLYQQIWAPLDKEVKTDKVMIIPDGVLYNVSVDMLPYEPIKSYGELAGKSLLARHTFSYHYSPFMLETVTRKNSTYKNYIAFAPGFSDNLKNDYLRSVKDSLHLDRKYLTLLPQPANNKLAKELNEEIGGELFLNGSSTASAFRRNADKHKIIHVATHAEYNNVLPEQSGLFFAKGNDSTDNNFLSLNEVYECSMNADLMILTACESGRPGFQDGEGLVSLAHAFNYAGSQNIVTALWKIDEQSSAVIAEEFIGFLKQGLPTDEALRQAKLSYLQNNEGRVLAPAYWSGLVLMGRPLSLTLDKPTYYLPWIIAGACLVMIAGGIFFFNRKRRFKSGN